MKKQGLRITCCNKAEAKLIKEYFEVIGIYPGELWGKELRLHLDLIKDKGKWDLKGIIDRLWFVCNANVFSPFDVKEEELEFQHSIREEDFDPNCITTIFTKNK